MASGEKAEYRSSLRAKKLIRQAFHELLLEKEKPKITVTDIVTRADINRRTFYAHYQDVRALAEQLEDEAIEKMIEIINEGKNDHLSQDPLPIIARMTEYIEANFDYFRKLFIGDDSEPFIRKLKNVLVNSIQSDGKIPQSVKDTSDFQVAAHFIAGGLVNVFQVWIRGDMGPSLREHFQAVARSIRVPGPDRIALSDEAYEACRCHCPGMDGIS